MSLVEVDNKGERHSKGKLRYDLFPPDAYEEIVRIYTRGAEKYSQRNWERGMNWGECLRALKSHLTKWEKGIDMDEEFTDCHHMAMVAWNAIALLTYELRKIGNNDCRLTMLSASSPTPPVQPPPVQDQTYPLSYTSPFDNVHNDVKEDDNEIKF